MFRGYNGEGYSWRKILTAIAALIFLIASIGFLFFDRPELPGSYQGIIVSVFAFYFFKDIARNISITKKDEE